MSRKKGLLQLIESSEKHEFDKIVKTYLQEEFNLSKIIMTDGKDDVGLDIKIFDFSSEKIQYQLTTQMSDTIPRYNAFRKKVYEDLDKARDNFKNFGYSNKLFFFYSYRLTNKRIRNFESKAFKDYKINLSLIDANRLAEEALEMVKVQEIIYHFSELSEFQIQTNLFDSPKENLVFDILTLGKPSEFKIQVIEVFIIQSIYNNKSLDRLGIIDLCHQEFKDNENDVFFDKLLAQLQTSKRIKKSLDRKNFIITSSEQSKLKAKIKQYELDEKLFLNDCSNILKEYDQQHNLNEYVIELKKLYSKNFNSDLQNLIHDESDPYYNASVKSFLNFIKSNVTRLGYDVLLAKDLLLYCSHNKFIQKIAASKVYIDNINNSNLSDYLITQKKVYIDTPIAIWALCYYYDPKFSYNDYFFQMSKHLTEYGLKEKIGLHIWDGYVWEIYHHINEAFNIIPFTYLPNYEFLGKSRNVFYNYYLSRKEHSGKNESFENFLANFGLNRNTSKKSLKSKIIHSIRNIGIITFTIEKEYKNYEAITILKKSEDKHQRTKNKHSRHNDAVILEYLSDNDVNLHPLQPLFLTWDKSFLSAHKTYAKEFPDAQDWLVMSPSKYIDSCSLLKFSIDSETVTETVLAHLSDDFISDTHQLIDTIKNILDVEDKVGLKYANSLAEIRRQEVDEISQKRNIPPESFEGEVIIDEVIFDLVRFYKNKDEDYIKSLKKIFTNPDTIDTVLSIILEAIDDYHKNQKRSTTFIKNFNKIVEQVRKE